MYNEPQHDEEKYRLKREDNDRGFNPSMFISWILFPGLIGMFCMTLLVVAVPSIVASMRRGFSFDLIADKLLQALDREFSLLVTLKWGETNLWAYLLFGALLAILIKYCYTDEKLR